MGVSPGGPIPTVLDLSPPMAWQATILAVHDGDTVTVDASLRVKLRKGPDRMVGFHLTSQGNILHLTMPVRLYGLNAAELATPAGQAAQVALSGLILGKSVVLTTWLDRNDKYGRILAGIMLDTTDVNQWLIDNNYAVSWDGHGPKPVPTP